MGDPVLLSVIIPTYNGGRHLDSCLSAIRRCLYVPHEIIVVDNGSVDDSRQIAGQYGVVIVDCPGPSGPGAARNAGANFAQGNILLFVDTDVMIHPDVLLRVLAIFKTQPDLAAVFGSYDTHPAAQNFISQYKNLLNHFVHQHAQNEASTFWGACGAIRSDVFHKIGGFDTQCNKPAIEDIEMGYRLRRAGYRIVLDKHMQGQHLKRWSFSSLIHTDIFCRAIPWTKLVLESRTQVNDLNLHRSQRASAGLVGVATIGSPLTMIEPLVSLAVLSCLMGVFLLNRELFRFFFRERGMRFAMASFPIHLLYFLYSGTVFSSYWASHTLVRRSVSFLQWLEKGKVFFFGPRESTDP
ncbi:MAG: glycosyltransferase family 2 protein [Nitrospirales bacterium]